MLVQTTLSSEDFEDLTDFCNREGISRAALINSLIKDFLETANKERRKSIVDEARKIRPGRPKEGDY